MLQVLITHFEPGFSRLDTASVEPNATIFCEITEMPNLELPGETLLQQHEAYNRFNQSQCVASWQHRPYFFDPA
jgi:hypothetical protein